MRARGYAAAGVIGLLAGVGLTAAAMHDVQASTPQDAQTTGTETIRMGDLEWLCLTTRTGVRIDARSCTLLDDMTGRPIQ